MSFYLKCFIPSLEKSCKFKELSFKQFLNINKFIVSEQDQYLEDYIDQIINENSRANENLTNYDKLIIMFHLRCLSVSPDLEFTVDKKHIKVNLLPFLNKCVNADVQFTKEYTNTDIQLQLRLPSRLTFENELDASLGLIHSIKVKDGLRLKINEYSGDIMDECIESIPVKYIQDIKVDYNQVMELFKDLTLDLPVLNQKIQLNPFDSSFLHFIKLLYRTSLLGIYNIQYILTSKLHYTPDYIDQITFSETTILLNMFEQEQKRIEQERSKNQPSSTSIPQRHP